MKRMVAIGALLVAGGVSPGMVRAQDSSGFHASYSGTLPGTCTERAGDWCADPWIGTGSASRLGPSTFTSRYIYEAGTCSEELGNSAYLRSTNHNVSVFLMFNAASCSSPEQGEWTAAPPASGSGAYTCTYSATPQNGTATTFTCTFTGRLDLT